MTKSTIYKIVCKYPLVTDCYVGRTRDVTTRFIQHGVTCNNKNGKAYNCKIYKTIRANGGFDNWCLVEIENIEHPDNDSLLAREREGFWFHELNATLNNNVPNQSPSKSKEVWKNKNPEYYKEYGKQYALTHKDDIAEKHKIYYGENKEMLNAKCKAWVQNNRDRNRAYQTQRYHKLKAKKLLEAQEGI
jgi:hypothetical protein